MWLKRFMAFAASKKYGGILSGRVIVPKVKKLMDTGGKEDSKLTEILERNIRAYADIVLAMKNRTDHLELMKCKTEDWPEGNARQAWETLRNKYLPTHGLELVAILVEYNEKRLRSVHCSPDVFIVELGSVRARLVELKTDVSDNAFLLKIVTSLLHEYESVVEYLTRKISHEEVNLQELKDKLLQKYRTFFSAIS